MLTATMILSACASTTRDGFVVGDQAPDSIKKKTRVAATASACKSLKGQWHAVNKPREFPAGGYCQWPTTDGGKACRSSHDCEGYCELSFADAQDTINPRCSTTMPPRWDRCLPGYFELGKILNRGECFGDEGDIQ